MNNKERACKIVQMAITDHDAGGWTECGINEIMETHIKSALDEKDKEINRLTFELDRAKSDRNKAEARADRIPRAEIEKVFLVLREVGGWAPMHSEQREEVCKALATVDGWLKEGK